MSECFLTRVGFSQHPQQRAEVLLLIRKQVFLFFVFDLRTFNQSFPSILSASFEAFSILCIPPLT